ncbi:hypothetical protein C0991_002792 [Blastosporella zonata]|nr:hypothetical protein C0991_002792 [Blastosporella zonata]
MMTSTGLPALDTLESIAEREPTKQDMDFVTPDEARVRWGKNSEGTNRVLSIEGNT